MKKILFIIAVGCMFILNSCSDFLTEEPTDSIPNSQAFTSITDVQSNLTGAYSSLGDYGLLNCDLFCYGDACADACYHNAASYNFLQLATWSVADTDDDLDYTWTAGYKVISQVAKIIQEGSKFEGADIEIYLAQAHALRAWTTFYLTNLFGLPYTVDPNALGVVNVETPILAGEHVSRNTVAENYDFMLKDVQMARMYYEKNPDAIVDNYHFNYAAVLALESRINLFMGNYLKARESALAAITAFKNDKLENTEDAYTAMWTTSTLSSEDIMRYARSVSQTHNYYFMWGPSGGIAFVPSVLAEIPENDIRHYILTNSQWGKFCGTELGNATLSLPMFRLAELYLTLAETYAVGDDIDYDKAAYYLSIVSDARHSAISGKIKIGKEILSQIQEERKWETLQEGFRWFDVRRWKMKVAVDNGKHQNFEISKFCYPIPASEVNSGFGVEQTPDWFDALPVLN